MGFYQETKVYHLEIFKANLDDEIQCVALT